MKRSHLKFAKFVAALSLGAAVFQLGGCSPFAAANNFFQSFNPCGSVLACDPTVFAFLTSGYKGPGVDPNVDPACTYPPYCADGDPFVPFLLGGP